MINYIRNIYTNLLVSIMCWCGHELGMLVKFDSYQDKDNYVINKITFKYENSI
jgi:hypothetical protein